MTSTPLNPDQSSALFDILSHAQVYREIRDFREPGTLSKFGPPFNSLTGFPSTSPSLQTLLLKFVLTLPELRDISKTFWEEHLYSIIEDFEKAELSESFDKGILGIRKTLATGASALIEYPVRGVFDGVERLIGRDGYYEYDMASPEDLARAFRDFAHQAVYGNVIDDLIMKAAETDMLSEHLPIVQAAHEYILVNLASFMHYTLVISPKGQYLLTLIDRANKLVPYSIIKQTLKIGNVASMINAIVKIVLAKMSVGSLTNWMGWTQTADEGMNLMQHIVSTVLHWDIRDLKLRALKTEKDRHGLEKKQLDALRSYSQLCPEQHRLMRSKSEKDSRSIVSVILSEAFIASDISEAQHKNALEYLGIELAIRDREQIAKVLCHTQPDHLTEAVRDVVAAYEPLIRAVHNAVDLSETFTDFELFLRDMLHISRLHHKDDKSKSQHEAVTPTVSDYIQLLKKHQPSCHKFLHQCAKNGKEVTSWFHSWACNAAAVFHDQVGSSNTTFSDTEKAVRSFTSDINSIFMALPMAQRDTSLQIIDAHARYLSRLHAASAARLASVVNLSISDNPIPRHKAHHDLFQSLSRSSSRQPGSSNGRSKSPLREHSNNLAAESGSGPGAFLGRWQALLDDTAITPATAQGPIRYGRNRDMQRTWKADVDGELKDDLEKTSTNNSSHSFKWMTTGEEGLSEDEKMQRPDVEPLVDVLLPAFRDLLAKRSCSWRGDD